MFFICGLGNPGKKFIDTKHNVGFNLIDNLLKNYKFSIIKKDKKKELFKGLIGKAECFLLKPQTFMNLSGPIIYECINYYKIKKNNIYVIHDDLDLITGKLKIKVGGGNAGHNGLESVDKSIGKTYNRIRIGIGHPGNKDLVSNYVLTKFSKNEKILINNKLKIITKYFEILFDDRNLFLTRIAEEEKLNGL